MQHKRNLLFLSCIIMMKFLNLSGHKLPTLEIYSAMSNRALDEEKPSVKRHADALYTEIISKSRYNAAVTKYLKSILTRPESGTAVGAEMAPSEPESEEIDLVQKSSIAPKEEVRPTGIIREPFLFPGYRLLKD